MSLINRMLQDLDSRGTESVGTGAMYAQIRSVPENFKRSSLRWLWLVLPLLCIITAVVWQSTHRPEKINQVAASQPQASSVVETPAQLSLMELKLSSGLNVAPLQGPQPAVQYPSDSNNVGVAADTAAPIPTNSKQADEKKNLSDKPAEPTQKTNISVPAAIATAVPVVAVIPKERVTTASIKPSEPAPAIINKQVNELSVQQRAENEYRKALLLIQQGKPAEAIAGLEQALQLDRQMASARQTLAGLLIDAKRQDDAIQRLQEGLAIDPTQAGLAMILARLQVEKNELRHALETLQRTLPYAADRADYQAFLAAVLQRDGKNKESAEHYVLALRQNPQNGIWWMGLGISLQAENRLPDAQDAFSRAKASNNLSPELQAFVDQKLTQLKH